jgi:hypothetical protein
MGFLKRYFINQSTLGMLKGLDPDINGEIDYDSYSPSRKVGIFLLASTARFVGELIMILLASLVIAIIDILTRYLPNIGTEAHDNLAKLLYEGFGLELNWWVFGLTSLCVWSILMVVFYLFCRCIVNIISITYLSIKKG